LQKNRIYKVRSFRKGDEHFIIELFNEQYEKYGGFVKRTLDYWFWCCMQRPDVDEDGILVVVDESEKVAGYAVVGKSGKIWEYSYDPEMDGKKILSLLFERAVKYLEENGASSVMFNAPSDDNIVKEVCKKVGFSEVLPEKMFLSVLSFSKLVASLIEKEASLGSKFNETVLVRLRDAPSWISDRFFIKIGKGKVEVFEDISDYTIILETDPYTFSSLLFGNMSPLRALISLKLKIKPLRKVSTLLKILSNLRVDTPWFFPLSDFG